MKKHFFAIVFIVAALLGSSQTLTPGPGVSNYSAQALINNKLAGTLTVSITGGTVTSGMSSADRAIADSTRSNTDASERYLASANAKLGGTLFVARNTADTTNNRLTALRKDLDTLMNRFVVQRKQMDTLNAREVTRRKQMDSLYVRSVTQRKQLDSVRLGNLPRIRYRLDTIYSAIERLKNQLIYTNNMMRYNNDKQDSMLASTNSTIISFTATSVNSGTAVVSGQTIGAGIYSVTVPAGNWRISSVQMSTSVTVSGEAIRLYLFSGSQNIASPAEGTAMTVSKDQWTELVSSYWCSNTYKVVLGNLSSYPMYYSLNSGMLTDNKTIPSGTLKILIIYSASYTPAANNVYWPRLYLTRVN